MSKIELTPEQQAIIDTDQPFSSMQTQVLEKHSSFPST